MSFDEMYALGGVAARSFFEANHLETALDLSSRFLIPLQDTDTRSLTFGLIALIISGIAQWITDEDKTGALTNGLDFDNNLIQNRNGVKKDAHMQYSGKMDKEIENSVNAITIDNYKETVSAFEEFMNWTKSQTKDDQMLEDVLQLAIAKARGLKNPADIFYKNIIDVSIDMYKKISGTISYYLF